MTSHVPLLTKRTRLYMAGHRGLVSYASDRSEV
jgi:hypothetical protein